MRSIAANAMTILIVFGVALAGLVYYGSERMTAPGPLTEDVIVEVPRGASFDTAVARLEEAGAIEVGRVVPDASILRIVARREGADRSLRFGEYAIPAGASMREVLDALVEGRTVQRLVTIPEGRTNAEVAAILAESPLLTGEIETMPEEGWLAPDSYAVQRGDTRQSLIDRMTEAQRRIVDEAWAARADGVEVASPEEAVILASIVEKETGLAEERPLIAGVFHNRLGRGMRLQSDPTIIYGVIRTEGRFDGDITRRMIDTRTDWNTYQINGLPPTAIANPGRAAIEAVLRPEATGALFFVADGTGGHAFAETLDEHNRNVAAWREIERARAGD